MNRLYGPSLRREFEPETSGSVIKWNLYKELTVCVYHCVTRDDCMVVWMNMIKVCTCLYFINDRKGSDLTNYIKVALNRHSITKSYTIHEPISAGGSHVGYLPFPDSREWRGSTWHQSKSSLLVRPPDRLSLPRTVPGCHMTGSSDGSLLHRSQSMRRKPSTDPSCHSLQ